MHPECTVAPQASRSGSDPLEAWAAVAMAEVHSKGGRWEDSDAALQQAAALVAGANSYYVTTIDM